MSGSFNYRYYRGRLKVMDVDVLPPGRWLKISEAASFLGMSIPAIRKKYLLGKLDCVRYNRLMYVLVPSDKC